MSMADAQVAEPVEQSSEPSESAIPTVSKNPDKKPAQSQKKNWLLTYCPAGTYITTELLKEDGLTADECHSTSDRVMNYTYIHLSNKVRQTRIEKFMKKVKESHGITQNEIFGYDSIASDSSTNQTKEPFQQHIVFKMLLKHCKENSPNFKPNTDGEPVLKRGCLFHALDITADRTTDLHFHNKNQLVAYAKSLEKKLEESKTQEAEMQGLVTTFINACAERSALSVENRDLKRKIAQLEEQLQKKST